MRLKEGRRSTQAAFVAMSVAISVFTATGEAQTIARPQGLSAPTLPVATVEFSGLCRNNGDIIDAATGARPICSVLEPAGTQFISGIRRYADGGSILGIGEVRTSSDGFLRAYSELRMDNVSYAGPPSESGGVLRAPQFLNLIRTGFRDEVSFAGVVPHEARLRVRVDGSLTSSSTGAVSAGYLDAGSYAVFSAASADGRAFGLSPSGTERPIGNTIGREGWEACQGSFSGCGDSGVGFRTISFFLRDGFSSFSFDYSASMVSRLFQPLSLMPGDTWSGLATADFLGTMFIDGASFFDDTGLEITDRVSASWSSGRTIAPIRSVPEPTTVALLGVGLLALGFVARRRRA